ncbi:MAG: hypothetical protein WEB60_03310 [Terrimicrobiaceae bacterium]
MKNPNPDPAKHQEIPIWNEGELVLYCEHLQTVKYRDPVAAGAPSTGQHTKKILGEMV